MALPGKLRRPLELHVLDEMRQPVLVVVFEHRPGLDDQPQLGAVGRLAVRSHVIAQPVRQRADDRLGVDRHLLRQGILRDRLGGGLASLRRRLGGLCCRQPRGGEDGKGGEGDRPEAGAHTQIL